MLSTLTRMRPLTALCSLGGQVVRLMAWHLVKRLYPVFDWLWRRLFSLWRWIAAKVLALAGRKDRGRSVEEPEFSDDENEVSQKSAAPNTTTTTTFYGAVTTEDRRVRAPVSQHSQQGEYMTDDEDDDVNEDEDDKKYRVERTDEFYCGYDSTWDSEEENQRSPPRSPIRGSAASRSYKFNRFENAARDMQNYRHDYPNKPHSWMRPASDDQPNLNFYLGRKLSEPDGVAISTFHNEWSGNYHALEQVHTYIQWLFPLQEPGVNYNQSPMTREEIENFLNSRTAKENLLRSYKLMLDFYGMELCDETTGEVKRAFNWQERFHNLDTHTHNNLRITRILKCLGTLGFRHYQVPLVRFFLEETLANGQLPNVKDSVLNYFVFAVLDRKERRNLLKFAYFKYDHRDEFVWCPKKIQRIWSRQAGALNTAGNEMSF